MEILGYIASLLIGISLGLIGGGGSILTVPVLVYLLHVEPVMATAYSLFIVGMSSLIGVFGKYKAGQVDLKTGIIFGVPSIISVYITRKHLLPALPEKIFEVGDFILTKPVMLMVLFALLMIAASFSMILERKNNKDESTLNGKTPENNISYSYFVILVEGTVVGILTGLVGAGGGFLIIPALVVLSKLPMKIAVGTSLMIIAVKSLIGFMGDVLNRGYEMNWILLLVVSLVAVVGIFIGNHISVKVDGNKLKKAFGWFVLVMGISIFIRELLA